MYRRNSHCRRNLKLLTSGPMRLCPSYLKISLLQVRCTQPFSDPFLNPLILDHAHSYEFLTLPRCPLYFQDIIRHTTRRSNNILKERQTFTAVLTSNNSCNWTSVRSTTSHSDARVAPNLKEKPYPSPCPQTPQLPQQQQTE